MNDRNLVEFIMNRVIPEPNSGCWLWTMAVNSWGYGHCKLDGKYQRGNRISYQAFVCDPGDNFVLHKCDNRLCVNPEHLYLGNREDNTRDMLKRNRQAKGEKNGSSKLTENAIREIREISGAKYSRSALALKYCVTPETISRIRHNSRKGAWTWLHCSEPEPAPDGCKNTD